MASDADDSGDEDIEALEAIRRACIFTDTDPHSLRPSSVADMDDDDEDFELVRGIRQRFNACCSSVGDEAPLTLKPLSMLVPAMEDDDDDDEDDFAILRRIQKRFSCYDQDADRLESIKEKQDQIHSKSTYPKKARSYSVELDKTNALKAVPDSLDIHNNSNTPETLDTDTPENFPSCLTEAYDTDPHDLIMVPTESSGFPKAALMFIDAIRKNRACQKFIRNKMMQTEARIEENRKLQHRIKVLRGFQIRCKKQTSRAFSQQQDACIQLISASKAKRKSKANGKKDSALCHGPAENSRVACYRMMMSEYQMSLNRRKWTEEERQNLAKGIKQQFQELLLQRSVDSISEMVGDSDEVDSLYASIREHDITSKDMRLFIPKVNWERLATMYMKGRCGAECEARWLNCEDPLINHNPWTNLEDKKLLHIVQQRGISNWIEIAVLLETNRTPFQCLARYQRSLNASILRSEWSKDEDEKLCAAVIALGESNWENVAATLVGRTAPQCSNRWIKSLNPARQRTWRWSEDEDKRVKVAVVFFGPKNWKKVAQFVPGRTHVQCRERWVNILDPSLNLGEWTQEEDSKLKEAIQEYGYCWAKIAACVPPRTDNQCRRRWKTLFPLEVPLLQDARRIQKAALISNFVDRESERPALGPQDFVPLQLTNADSESGELNQPGKQGKKSRSKKATKEIQFCSDEVLSTTGVDVEKVTSEKANLKKKLTPRRCKNKKASEATEDARVGEEILPIDVETNKKTLEKQKMPSRSKKGTKDTVVCTSEVLLTNGVDAEKVADEERNSKKKPTRRRYKKNHGASEPTEDATPVLRNETLLTNSVVEKVAAERVNSKKKLTPRRGKKNYGASEGTEDATLVLRDETPLTNNVDVEKVAAERVNSKKNLTPRRGKQNNGASERIDDATIVLSDETLLTNSVDVEKAAGERINSKKKLTPRRGKKNNGASEGTEDATLVLRDETLLTNSVDVEKAACEQINLKKKLTPRRGKKNNGASEATEDATLLLRDETLLANSVDVENVVGEQINSKRKLTPRQGKKNKCASEAPGDARVGQEIMPFNGETKKKRTFTESKIALREGPKEKNGTATPKLDTSPETNSRVSTCGDSEVFNATHIEEANNKRSPENENNEQCHIYDKDASSFGENEACSEVLRFSSPHAEQDRVDPTEVNSSPYQNSKSPREKDGFASDGKRRKVADVAEISDSETLGSVLLKEIEMRRRERKVDSKSSAHDDSCYRRERKGRKSRSKMSENIKVENKSSIVDRGGKRKRSSFEERLCIGNMTLASFIKRRQKTRSLE